MTEIVKQTVRFPFNKATSDADVTGAPIPGPSSSGSQVFIGDGNFFVDPDPGSLSAEQLGQKIQILPTRNNLPLTGISIAPDSAIQCCDIQLSGSGGDDSRHRLSPGNPFIGSFSGDYAFVTLPVSIPTLNGASGNGNHGWDTVPITPGAGGVALAFPLRLEFWYGGIPVRSHRRAPYVARYKLAEMVAAAEAGFYICVDGRNRIVLDFFVDSAGFSFTVSGITATARSPGNADDIQGVYPVIASTNLTAGYHRVVIANDGDEDNVAPYTILLVVVTDSVGLAGSDFHQVGVRAYDD